MMVMEVVITVIIIINGSGVDDGADSDGSVDVDCYESDGIGNDDDVSVVVVMMVISVGSGKDGVDDSNGSGDDRDESGVHDGDGRE